MFLFDKKSFSTKLFFSQQMKTKASCPPESLKQRVQLIFSLKYFYPSIAIYTNSKTVRCTFWTRQKVFFHETVFFPTNTDSSTFPKACCKFLRVQPIFSDNICQLLLQILVAVYIFLYTFYTRSKIFLSGHPNLTVIAAPSSGSIRRESVH